jgi:hypothetical protein
MKKVRQIAKSVERFGFTNPVLVSPTGEIIAGHGRVAAAKMLTGANVALICATWSQRDSLNGFALLMSAFDPLQTLGSWAKTWHARALHRDGLFAHVGVLARCFPTVTRLDDGRLFPA